MWLYGDEEDTKRVESGRGAEMRRFFLTDEDRIVDNSRLTCQKMLASYHSLGHETPEWQVSRYQNQAHGKV
jgi:hypothetical protein